MAPDCAEAGEAVIDAARTIVRRNVFFMSRWAAFGFDAHYNSGVGGKGNILREGVGVKGVRRKWVSSAKRHAGFLAPLVKAWDFGMTPTLFDSQLTKTAHDFAWGQAQGGAAGGGASLRSTAEGGCPYVVFVNFPPKENHPSTAQAHDGALASEAPAPRCDFSLS